LTIPLRRQTESKRRQRESRSLGFLKDHSEWLSAFSLDLAFPDGFNQRNLLETHREITIPARRMMEKMVMSRTWYLSLVLPSQIRYHTFLSLNKRNMMWG
jgi:hypothetical protein